MSDARIAEIKERLAKASPGPWVFSASLDKRRHSVSAPASTHPEASLVPVWESDPNEIRTKRHYEDAVLIANAPSDLAFLLEKAEKICWKDGEGFKEHPGWMAPDVGTADDEPWSCVRCRAKRT